jgi:hypothetical protein
MSPMQNAHVRTLLFLSPFSQPPVPLPGKSSAFIGRLPSGCRVQTTHSKPFAVVDRLVSIILTTRGMQADQFNTMGKGGAPYPRKLDTTFSLNSADRVPVRETPFAEIPNRIGDVRLSLTTSGFRPRCYLIKEQRQSIIKWP